MYIVCVSVDTGTTVLSQLTRCVLEFVLQGYTLFSIFNMTTIEFYLSLLPYFYFSVSGPFSP